MERAKCLADIVNDPNGATKINPGMLSPSEHPQNKLTVLNYKTGYQQSYENNKAKASAQIPQSVMVQQLQGGVPHILQSAHQNSLRPCNLQQLQSSSSKAVLQQIPQQQIVSQPQLDHRNGISEPATADRMDTDNPQSKLEPQKMFLQLQKDPKTGFFVVNKGTHGYHPGRHLQHQLQQRQMQHNPSRHQMVRMLPPQQQQMNRHHRPHHQLLRHHSPRVQYSRNSQSHSLPGLNHSPNLNHNNSLSVNHSPNFNHSQTLNHTYQYTYPQKQPSYQMTQYSNDTVSNQTQSVGHQTMPYSSPLSHHSPEKKAEKLSHFDSSLYEQNKPNQNYTVPCHSSPSNTYRLQTFQSSTQSTNTQANTQVNTQANAHQLQPSQHQQFHIINKPRQSIVYVNGNIGTVKGALNTIRKPFNQQQHPAQLYFAVSGSVPSATDQGTTLQAKIIKTYDGERRDKVNGVIPTQQEIKPAAPRMFAIRYALPSKDSNKLKHYTLYSAGPTVNTKSSHTEKQLLPKPADDSQTPADNVKQNTDNSKKSDNSRKRKIPQLLPPKHTNKQTKIEPKAMAPEFASLLERVNKSLDADREVVDNPDCKTPFGSFPDAFRRLMKYHIANEPDVKEIALRKADKVHEQISLKLLQHKQDLENRFHELLLKDAAKPLPSTTYACDMHLLLTHNIIEEKKRLADMSERLKKAKIEARIRLRDLQEQEQADSCD